MKTLSTSETDRLKALVEKYQCPGCVCGSDTSCEAFDLQQDQCFKCRGHVLGTMLMGVGNIALGLPKGFNRPGWTLPPEAGEDSRTRNQMFLRIHLEEEKPHWDEFNIPVWAMEHEGDLLVRTFLPRTGVHYVDIFENQTLQFIPDEFNVIDVAKFKDEID